MSQNNYAKHKPTVVLLAQPNQEVQALQDADGKPRVFAKFTKAAKFVSNNIDTRLHPFIEYVNESPQLGAGDREETSNKRCLKCKGFLRPSHEVGKMNTPMNTTVEVEEFICPKCDLGE
jgi:uncharacterized protein with PIN domain